MSHVCFTYHIVWRTKRSENTISELNERQLYAYLYGICKKRNCYVYRINSMPDHVHICLEIPPEFSVSHFVQVLKQESSKWISNNRNLFPYFNGWGNGYAAFSYSRKERPVLIEYIKNQKSHHRITSFREELVELLQEMGMESSVDLFFKD